MLKEVIVNTEYSFEDFQTTLESMGFQNVKLSCEGRAIYTNSQTFKIRGFNFVEESVEDFYVTTRGKFVQFYKGYELITNLKFYKKSNVEIKVSINDYRELLNEAIDRLNLLNEETGINLKVCLQSFRTFFDIKKTNKNIQVHILLMDLINEYKINPITYFNMNEF
jgi:hypothetical protein